MLCDRVTDPPLYVPFLQRMSYWLWTTALPHIWNYSTTSLWSITSAYGVPPIWSYGAMELNRALSRQHVSAYHCLQRIKQVLQQRLCLHLQPYMRRQSTSAVLIECGDKENFFELRRGRKNSFFFWPWVLEKGYFLTSNWRQTLLQIKRGFLSLFS